MRQITVETHGTSGVLAAQLTLLWRSHQSIPFVLRKDRFMSNFPTPLEEVIHHNVIKNNKTGGPALDVGQMKLFWRALGENTGYTFSIFESTLAPGMGIPLHRHPFPEFFYVLEGNLSIGYWNNQGVTEWDACEAGESGLPDLLYRLEC